MLEGTIGTVAVVVGVAFLVLLRGARWLSIRRPESWFAVGLIVVGLWFIWGFPASQRLGAEGASAESNAGARAH